MANYMKHIDWRLTDNVHDDTGGTGIRFTCPDCHSEMVYAPGGWWHMTCCCRNRKFDVNVVITYRDPK
jgi:hypothetical protein